MTGRTNEAQHKTRRIPINAERLLTSMRDMAAIGATPRGGVTRLALSDEDKQSRDLFRDWLQAAGLDIRVDDLGNIYGWRAGREPDLPPVLIGSHLDSIRQGGKYDGALGTLAALECIRTLNDLDVQTRRTLGVVSFTGEEGARFEPSILGPSVLTGRFTLDYVYARTDRYSGVTLGEELERIGYKGEQANRTPKPAAFIELHIEQGPVLDREGLAIGVVEGIVGLTWLEVTLTGQADHAGPSPMAGRRDALVGASRIITAVRDMARELDPDAVATVGRLKVEPDIINVIPGQVTFGVDIRHPDEAQLVNMAETVREIVSRIAGDEKLEFDIEQVGQLDVTRFDPTLIDAVEDVTRECGFSFRRIISGAGHDSQWMARFCPTTMIFVPSKNGKSHCEEEETGESELVQGATVLANAALRLAQG